jgi:dihydrofolate reductase
MGAIHVHEFVSLDGVADTPTWTFEYGFDPKMGETLAALTGSSEGILLGRKTYEMFEPAWSTRTVEDDPGAPFFNDTTKYVVSGTAAELTWRNSGAVGACYPAAIQRLKEPPSAPGCACSATAPRPASSRSAPPTRMRTASCT